MLWWPGQWGDEFPRERVGEESVAFLFFFLESSHWAVSFRERSVTVSPPFFISETQSHGHGNIALCPCKACPFFLLLFHCLFINPSPFLIPRKQTSRPSVVVVPLQNIGHRSGDTSKVWRSWSGVAWWYIYNIYIYTYINCKTPWVLFEIGWHDALWASNE